PPPDQLGLDRLEVDLLHPPGRLVGLEFGDLLVVGGRILVAGPQALEVEHSEPAELSDLDGGGGADGAVHRRSQHGELEAERVQLPADVDVVGVSCPAAGDDGYVVESERLPTRFADTDVDFHEASSAARRAPRRVPVRSLRPDRYAQPPWLPAGQ